MATYIYLNEEFKLVRYGSPLISNKLILSVGTGIEEETGSLPASGAQSLSLPEQGETAESWAVLGSHRATPPTLTEHFCSVELMKLAF